MQSALIVNAPDSAMVCHCGKVTKGQILQAVAAGNRTFEQLRRATGACPEDTDCAANNPSGRCCAPEVTALLKSHAPESDTKEPVSCCSCCGQPNAGK